jgi:RNA polymerase sigma-70 factor (ECF subfamily)
MDISLEILKQEEDFIKACVAKEKWALKIVYEQHYSSMMLVCRRYSNNDEDALDILHDGFIKVFRYMEKYQPGTSIQAWIRRIMVNTSIDYYRKESRRRTENIDNAYDLSSNLPDVVSLMSANEILDSLRLLSPAYRAVFNLYVMEGYSHREIAEQLNITESTSRSNLVKARGKLKNIILSKEYNK